MDFKKQTIAVTGGTGFIGSKLIPRLLKKGFRVKVLTRNRGAIFPKDVTVYNGDLSTGNLGQFLKETDILIHLAARRFPPEEEMFPNNVAAAQNLLVHTFKSPIKQVIMVSTVAVYGEGYGTSFVEENKCLPNTVYGLTKYLGENIINFWAVKTGKPLTILRPFNVYGPGSSNGVIYSFCQSLKEKRSLTVFGDGSEKRDFLYVDDLIDAILKAISKKANGIFNLGSGKNLSISELVNLFKDITKKDIKINFIKEEGTQIKNLEYKIDKAKKMLGWEPKTTLHEGLTRTINWYNKLF